MYIHSIFLIQHRIEILLKRYSAESDIFIRADLINELRSIEANLIKLTNQINSSILAADISFDDSENTCDHIAT